MRVASRVELSATEIAEIRAVTSLGSESGNESGGSALGSALWPHPHLCRCLPQSTASSLCSVLGGLALIVRGVWFHQCQDSQAVCRILFLRKKEAVTGIYENQDHL